MQSLPSRFFKMYYIFGVIDKKCIWRFTPRYYAFVLSYFARNFGHVLFHQFVTIFLALYPLFSEQK